VLLLAHLEEAGVKVADVVESADEFDSEYLSKIVD